MAQFDNAIALANKLITKYGQSATLRRYAITAGAQAWRKGTATSTDYTITIAFIPQGTDSRVEPTSQYVDGENTHQQLERVYVAPNSPVVPNIKDKVIADSIEWSVVGMRKFAPNGQNVLYELVLTR